MKRKKFWVIIGRLSLILTFLGSMLLAFAVTATAQTPAPKPEAKTTWILATNPGHASNSWSFHPYPRFQKLLETRSGGRLVLDTKVGLFPPNEVIHAVIAGRADVGWERTPWLAGTFPLWDVCLPFLWDNIFEYEAFVNDPRMVEIDKKTYGEKGLVKIADICVEALDGIFARKSLATLPDFKGMKIRTAGLIPTLALKLMGASPLSIPTAEIFEAVKRGTVDAIQTSRGWGLGFGLPDVCTHVNYWKVQSVFSGMLIVNKAKFDALPPDLQKILLETGREMQGQAMYAAKVDEMQADIGVKVSRLKVIQPDPAEINKATELVRPVIDEWLKRAGPHGKEVLAIAGEYAGGAKIMLKK
ncbi:MAG: TRAP transporter substrate-binding protein DctP [Thermodesulfobacteriota bacterium]|nr:TRAP transporter substrate-binding protein DctP [Thermodesulfobacteriota bacterium]